MEVKTNEFNYSDFTTRNIGFVTIKEQEKLRSFRLFVCGVGGMGGAAIQSLARSGFGSFILADIDKFEISNLNRQVFSNLNTVGQSKAEATKEAIKNINPLADVKLFSEDWLTKIDEILSLVDLVINGMDDILATILLYRKAKEHGLAVIDAYASPLPSVTCVLPSDPRPEERLNFATAGKSPDQINESDLVYCQEKETEYVIIHSSSHKYIDLDLAAEVVQKKRSRMSIAPMVICTGNLMAYEALAFALAWKTSISCKGYFFNPFTSKCERPLWSFLAFIKGYFVRQFLKSLLKNG